jgi:scyllo-inositol 2-dehydrogenase (NADP+)
VADNSAVRGTAVRAAVVGYGLAGRVFHTSLISAADGLELVAVVTGNPERQAQVRAAHPGAAVLGSADELFAAAETFDLLVVATPNDAHAPLALAAIGRGKAVVVDKPMALTAAEAGRVVDAAAAAGTVLTVFQNRRWDTDQLTLRRLLSQGALGTVLRYESRFERWRPQPRPGSWREALPAEQGGGLLLDLGSHLVDQALHLFGPAVRVYAEVDARRGESDDDAFVAVEHAGGVRSHLWAGALAGAPGPRLRVLGSAGAYLVEPLDRQEDVLRDTGRLPAEGLTVGREDWGRLARGEESEAVPSEPGRWDLYYPAVAAAVRGEGPVPVDPADAVRALTVIEAARESARTHAVVGLPG